MVGIENDYDIFQHDLCKQSFKGPLPKCVNLTLKSIQITLKCFVVI